jgi:hypothetical protein
MVAHGRPITLCADGQWAGVWNLECLTDDEAVAWGMGVAMKIRPSPRERRMGRGRDPPHLSLPSPDCWPRGQATRSPGLMSAALTGTRVRGLCREAGSRAPTGLTAVPSAGNVGVFPPSFVAMGGAKHGPLEHVRSLVIRAVRQVKSLLPTIVVNRAWQGSGKRRSAPGQARAHRPNDAVTR